MYSRLSIEKALYSRVWFFLHDIDALHMHDYPKIEI